MVSNARLKNRIVNLLETLARVKAGDKKIYPTKAGKRLSDGIRVYIIRGSATTMLWYNKELSDSKEQTTEVVRLTFGTSLTEILKEIFDHE